MMTDAWSLALSPERIKPLLGGVGRCAISLLAIVALASASAQATAKSSSKTTSSSKSYTSKSAPSSPGKSSAFARFKSNKASPPSATSQKPSKYCGLKDCSSVGAGKPFTAKQKFNVIRENMRQNKGRVRDDSSGRYLAKPQRLNKGVKPSPNEYQVDHVVPRKPANPQVASGSNSYSNAQVISRDANRKKSNKTTP